MTIFKILKLDPAAHAPEKAHPGDLGFDLFSNERQTIPAGEMRPVKTGIAVAFPAGWGGIIKDRSSLAFKRIVTSAGVIDNGYRGEIMILLTNNSAAEVTIEAGQKIAQLIPCPVVDWTVEVVEDLSETSRGANGFGSTGAHKVIA